MTKTCTPPEVHEENKKVYLSYKQEGYTDEEIAKLMFVGTSTLCTWKRVWGVKVRKPRDNDLGITRDELLIAEGNGIDRHTVMQRVRVYEWTIEDAIHIPIMKSFRERRYFKKGY